MQQRHRRISIDLAITLVIFIILWLIIAILYKYFFHMRMQVPMIEDSQIHFLQIAPIPTSIVSIAASILLIVCYLLTPSVRNVPVRIISLYMSMCDVINNSAILLYKLVPAFCVAQAAITQYFMMAKLLWTFCLCFCIYAMLVRNAKLNDFYALELALHWICWTVPLLFSTALLVFHLYAHSSLYGWCWMQSTSWQFLFWRTPFELTLVYVMLVYSYAVVYSIRQWFAYRNAHQYHVVRNMAMITAVRAALFMIGFVITWIWSLIGFYIWEYTGIYVFWLAACGSVFGLTQGLWNCLAFGAVYQHKVVVACKNCVLRVRNRWNIQEELEQALYHISSDEEQEENENEETTILVST